jgi:hypothetical protein
MHAPFRGIVPLVAAIVLLCLSGCGRRTPRPPATAGDSEPLPPEADLSPEDAAQVLQSRSRAGPAR